MADVVALRGYADTRVSDLLSYAGMSRRTFYTHFDNIEDCFFAAHAAIRDDALTVLDQPPLTDAPAEIQLTAAVEHLLTHFAGWPNHAMLLMVHVLGAGPLGVREYERTMVALARRLIACLGDEFTDPHDEPQLIAQAVIGAMQRVVQLGLLGGKPQALNRLAPTLAAVAMRMAA
jgi:AcrR family transcriptional regulator